MNYPPDGGLEACNWEEVGSYGGYCEESEGEEEGDGEEISTEYCSYLEDEALVSSNLYCDELNVNVEDKEIICLGEEGYPDPDSPLSFCEEPTPSACEQACLGEGYSLDKCTGPCSKLENIYEACYLESGNDCDPNSNCYSNCMESINDELDCSRFLYEKKRISLY